MKPRNLHVRNLFEAITDEKLPIGERNHLALTSIKAITALKLAHEGCKPANPELKSDQVDEIGLDLSDENGATPLTFAAFKGYTLIVSALLEAKANPYVLNEKTGGTPLTYAVEASNTESVRLLLEAKANPDVLNEKTGAPPLVHAVHKGPTESVRLLLEAKANPDALDKKTGGAPLTYAVQTGHMENIRLLLEAKANPDMSNEKTSCTPLVLAIYKGYTWIVSALLDAKANPYVLDKKTDSISFTYAAQTGHTESIRLLLEAKANINYLDRFRKSALDYAIEKRNPSTALLLLQYNAKFTDRRKLLNFISSQDQNDPCVIHFLSILLNTPTLLTKRMRKNAEIYLSKLVILYNSYLVLIDEECSPTQFPHEIVNLMLSYDGRFFEPDLNTHTPMKFLNFATANPHLSELKKEFLKRTRETPGLFSQTIKKIDDAIKQPLKMRKRGFRRNTLSVE
jgi:ankyrin repeat protein